VAVENLKNGNPETLCRERKNAEGKSREFKRKMPSTRYWKKKMVPAPSNKKTDCNISNKNLNKKR
jgi:hypothetical protein